MLSATEIRNAKFGKSMNGYKQEDVDILLDRVEADYVQYERIIKDFQDKTEGLNKEIEELKNAQNSIQNVLLSAQRLADQIVNEAKVKSEEIINNAEASISIITAREKELSTTFERKAQERKATLEKELTEMIKAAELKAESIKKASEDSVERQQLLFEKIRMEVAAFKAGVTAKYKEHLEILGTIPDSVPMDPKQMAQAVAVQIDKVPNPDDFISSGNPFEGYDEEIEETETNEDGFVVAEESEELAEEILEN